MSLPFFSFLPSRERQSRAVFPPLEFVEGKPTYPFFLPPSFCEPRKQISLYFFFRQEKIVIYIFPPVLEWRKIEADLVPTIADFFPLNIANGGLAPPKPRRACRRLFFPFFFLSRLSTVAVERIAISFFLKPCREAFLPLSSPPYKTGITANILPPFFFLAFVLHGPSFSPSPFGEAADGF